MPQQNLDERKAGLDNLRDVHVGGLAGMRQPKADLSATAVGAKARYD